MLPEFATEQLTGLIETYWDSDGTVHFTLEGKAHRGWRCVCVCLG